MSMLWAHKVLGQVGMWTKTVPRRRAVTLSHRVKPFLLQHSGRSMQSCQVDSEEQSQILPLLQQNNAFKPPSISASSLLHTLRAARSASNPFKTLSDPIDSLIGADLRPGYALQISSPPGLYVEQLLLGFIKSVARAGKETMVIDMQNKLIPAVIFSALDQDDRSKTVYYQKCFTPDDVITKLKEFNNFIRTHPELSLLVLSSLSSPLQLEQQYSKRKSYIDAIRKLIVKLCKEFNIVVIITSNMSTQFAKPDGSKGTYNHDNTGVLIPQIDLSCKAIGSLVLSRTNRTSGQACLNIETKPQRSVEFDYHGMEFVPKVR